MKLRYFCQHFMVLTSIPFWIYSFCIFSKNWRRIDLANVTHVHPPINQTVKINIIDSPKILITKPQIVTKKLETVIPPTKKFKKVLINTIRQPTLPYNLIEETVGVHWKTTNCSVGCNALEYANINRLQQNHPCVVDLIRRLYLYPPSPRDVPYMLDSPDVVDPSDGRSKAILRLLGNPANGFFIESGALDGEFNSNSLYLERSFNWSGILVEAGPESFAKLQKRKRKSYTSPICVSPETYPMKNSFVVASSGEGCTDSHGLHQGQKKRGVVLSSEEDEGKVQCFPLYSILLAVNRSSIDYLGIDVKGQELKVLLTVPWSRMDIAMLSVRWNRAPEVETAITGLMVKKGYVKFGMMDLYHATDIIYVRDFLKDFLS